MSANPSRVPDAWDDDWESVADKQIEQPPAPAPEPEKKLSSRAAKAQRRAEHAEFNRQLWAEAESPEVFHFAEARSAVPLKSEFKPAVTVLSRKPQIAKRDASSNVNSATAGIQRLAVRSGEGDDGDDLEDSDEESKPRELTPEERQAKAYREREEKQRKYEEVRERLFGTSSGASSPGSTTPPRQSRNAESKGRGRNPSRGSSRRESKERKDSSNTSSRARQLYEPNYSQKPSSNYAPKKKEDQQPGQSPIRMPRGPDGSGRGGFAFGPRGRGT